MKTMKTIATTLMTAGAFMVTSVNLAHADSNPSGWNKKMRELYTLLASIVTETSSPTHFETANQQHLLEKDAKQLADTSKKLLSEKKPETDPSLQMLMGLFSDQADRAVRELKRGHTEYAVELLRSMPGYCIACHTRTQNGPRFSSLPLAPASKALSHYELGRFYAATRQFDRAMDEFTAVLDEKNSVIARPLQWEGAVRYALAIAVRTNRNPDQALAIVERVLNTDYAPYFVKQNAEEWKKSLLEWRAEPVRSPKSAQGFLSEGQRLIVKAHEAQKFPADRSADILYLRASSAAHELLASNPDPDMEAQGYLLAATAYQTLRDLGIEDFHEMYYEACIRTTPHTAIAEACFDRLQESLFADYSGSSGLNIPDDVREKLGVLESMARSTVTKPK